MEASPEDRGAGPAHGRLGVLCGEWPGWELVQQLLSSGAVGEALAGELGEGAGVHQPERSRNRAKGLSRWGLSRVWLLSCREPGLRPQPGTGDQPAVAWGTGSLCQ